MFGERIKALRKERGLSQSEFAEAMGLSQSTVANYEKNTRTPHIEIIIKFAEYFETGLDYLMGQTDIKQEAIPLEDMTMIQISDLFLDFLINERSQEANHLIDNFLNFYSIESLYFKLFRYTLSKLGWLWEVGAIGISKEHEISYEIGKMIANTTETYKMQHNISTVNMKVIGMAAPGEKHNLGLRMALAVLAFKGYQTYYIGDAVPAEDVNQYIEDKGPSILILSITSTLLQEQLKALIDDLSDVPIMISGMGIDGFNLNNNNVVGVFKTYEQCLEAIYERTIE